MTTGSTLPWPTFSLYGGCALCGLLFFWAFISYVISYWSGWRTLARSYADRENSNRSASAWPGSFMGLLEIGMGPLFCLGVSKDGLFLSMRFQEWLGYEPLLVPWRDV